MIRIAWGQWCSRHSKGKREMKNKEYVQAVKVEFDKITWPGKKALKKKSIMVIAAAAALGAAISVMDYIFKFLIDAVVTLIG